MKKSSEEGTSKYSYGSHTLAMPAEEETISFDDFASRLLPYLIFTLYSKWDIVATDFKNLGKSSVVVHFSSL